MSRSRSAPLPIYSDADFERIAKAISDDFDVSRLLALRNKFESAARWYELDTASPKRIAPNLMVKKFEGAAAAARKLLNHLDIRDPADAPDGPGDVAIFEVLASVDGETEDSVSRATAQVGSLVEILEKAITDVTRLGDLTVPKEHQGDAAVNNWIASMMGVFREISGKAPGTSVVPPGRTKKRGTADGPLIRFLEAGGQPLGISYSPSSWRSRVRTIKKSEPRQK